MKKLRSSPSSLSSSAMSSASTVIGHSASHSRSSSTASPKQFAFFTDPTIQMKAIRSSKKYTANKELSMLAHRIYRGEDKGIVANIPPKNITYEILFDEIGSELESETGLDSLYLQTKTKRELRIEWWKIWYRIIARKRQRRRKQSKQIAGSPSKKEVEAELAIIVRESEIELLKIREKIKLIQEALREQKIREALRIRSRVEGMSHDSIMGLIDTIDKRVIYPTNQMNTLFSVNKVFHIYGMQLPHQFDRIALLQSIFYLFKKKIYNMVDLHDCVNGTNEEHPYSFMGIGCNTSDSHAEPEMWALAVEKYKTIKPELNATYYNVAGYKDMTAGSLSAWNMISTSKDITKVENCVVIHCLAGAGRTGSAMLYLLLRDCINIPQRTENDRKGYLQRIALPHFGFKDINEFIHYCKVELFTFENSNTNFMKKELFKVSKLAYASLFRQRLNYIMFCLARHHNVKEFYTYEMPTKKILILPDDEFSTPCLHTIRDWKTLDCDSETVLKWFD